MNDAELDVRLSELLRSYDVLSASAVTRAQVFTEQNKQTLAAALTELQLVPAETLVRLLTEITGIRAVDPEILTVYPDFCERIGQLIPPPLMASALVFPAQMEVNRIHVCMVNPTDGWTVPALEAISGCQVTPLIATETAIGRALAQHFTLPAASGPRRDPPRAERDAERTYRELLDIPMESLLEPAVSLVNRNRDALARDLGTIESLIREPVVIRLVQQIICRSVENGASDLHIESNGEFCRVRSRVDGSLRVVAQLPGSVSSIVLGRLKALAGLPVGPADGPLDARVGYQLVWGRSIDLRFSLIPAITGEKVVLRVLDRSAGRRRLADLGVDPITCAQLEEASGLPHGLILATGPTGSGKSSTLYSLLDLLNSDGLALFTAEDPVESRIPGVTQVQCSEASGVSYAAALRSFLRQDPDVVMVGEIRDAETADIALKAALTGHLVLSTLHTNDAPGAVLRLINMGLEPFIIASALRLVAAQRLVRRLCPACKQPQEIDVATHPAFASLRNHADLADPRCAGPVGCASCGGSGFRGRFGIFEVLRVTARIEELILQRAPAAEIRKAARDQGMRTLRESALLNVVKGETSLAEALEHTAAFDEVEPLVAG